MILNSATTLRNNVIELPIVPERRLILENVTNWHDPIKNRLNELCKLQKGWDGYAAEPVAFLTAHFALSMLNSFLFDGVPLPAVVPGFSGDLQVEWHLLNGDIEVHVRRPNEVEAWFLNKQTGVETTIHLRNEFSSLYEWLKIVVEPVGHVEASAA